MIIDDDIVEVTNLNRLHGATQADADAMRPKADVVAASIAAMGLGTRVVSLRGWVNAPHIRDALKASDVVLCCTDDHAGRVFLNRLAYFYLIPVFDMGLALAVATPPATGMADISARVTTVMPPEPCLLCRGAVDLDEAREENLRRQNPTEYERSKREAYVRGEGNPNPAVVTFTTEIACMAVNELLNRIVGFRNEIWASRFGAASSTLRIALRRAARARPARSAAHATRGVSATWTRFLTLLGETKDAIDRRIPSALHRVAAQRPWSWRQVPLSCAGFRNHPEYRPACL